MICKRCDTTIPDNCTVCPVCGNPLVRPKNNRAKRIRRVALLSPILNFLLWGVNLFILLVAGHLPVHLSSDPSYVLQTMYLLYPGLDAANVIFALLFTASLVLSLFATYRMQKYRRSGPILLAVSHATQFCWTLLYPAALYFIVGTLSPIWLPILIGAAVYAIAATYTTVYLFRTGLFI